jgi:hypothetical protein
MTEEEENYLNKWMKIYYSPGYWADQKQGGWVHPFIKRKMFLMLDAEPEDELKNEFKKLKKDIGEEILA